MLIITFSVKFAISSVEISFRLGTIERSPPYLLRGVIVEIIPMPWEVRENFRNEISWEFLNRTLVTSSIGLPTFGSILGLFRKCHFWGLFFCCRKAFDQHIIISGAWHIAISLGLWHNLDISLLDYYTKAKELQPKVGQYTYFHITDTVLETLVVSSRQKETLLDVIIGRFEVEKHFNFCMSYKVFQTKSV